ncbi:putative F-box domain-containing protein [Tanacetum coccineum]
MERIPVDLCIKILSALDHHDLVAAHQVCRKWKLLASDNVLWSNLFTQRWGIDRAIFYAPTDSKSWKDVYAVQDRCDRLGLGLKIVREGDDYFLIHQGEIQRHLGSRTLQLGTEDVSSSSNAGYTGDEIMSRNNRQMGILDRILFFIGDLETASAPAKRGRLL